MGVNIATLLQQAELRHTKVREDVLSLIIKTPHAVSSNDIDKTFPGLDRITLYRTLKSFEEKGLIHKIVDHSGTKYAICNECTEHVHHDEHLHFHCEKCGNTFCLEETSTPSFKLPEGFKVSQTSVVVTGTCNKC